MKKSRLVSPSQIRGQHFETLALNYLLEQGLQLIELNFACPCGEIDLILKDADTLVFVEVRFRKNTSYGGAIGSIHIAKQKKIIKSAQIFLQRHALYDKVPSRFDVIGLTQARAQLEYLWIKSAFQ